MMEYFAIIGTIVILFGLLYKRIVVSLIALTTGSIMIALAISETAGWIPALYVASLFAGGLVALMTTWIIIVAKEEARIDVIYALAVVLMLIITFSLYLIVVTGKVTINPKTLSRTADPEDFSLLTILLVTSIMGGLRAMRGEINDK